MVNGLHTRAQPTEQDRCCPRTSPAGEVLITSPYGSTEKYVVPFLPFPLEDPVSQAPHKKPAMGCGARIHISAHPVRIAWAGSGEDGGNTIVPLPVEYFTAQLSSLAVSPPIPLARKRRVPFNQPRPQPTPRTPPHTPANTTHQYTYHTFRMEQWLNQRFERRTRAAESEPLTQSEMDSLAAQMDVEAAEEQAERVSAEARFHADVGEGVPSFPQPFLIPTQLRYDGITLPLPVYNADPRSPTAQVQSIQCFCLVRKHLMLKTAPQVSISEQLELLNLGTSIIQYVAISRWSATILVETPLPQIENPADSNFVRNRAYPFESGPVHAGVLTPTSIQPFFRCFVIWHIFTLVYSSSNRAKYRIDGGWSASVRKYILTSTYWAPVSCQGPGPVRCGIKGQPYLFFNLFRRRYPADWLLLRSGVLERPRLIGRCYSLGCNLVSVDDRNPSKKSLKVEAASTAP
ncbi:hypothetical protein C8R43DRAFT_954668 [Mycena crocata]|nr:hypothetical protein C8R43DRAFT_954668 [Mycena crocata]